MDELLSRGVDKIYPSKEELEKLLKSGEKLTLYQGFDPTGTQLHIGHMVGLRKLRQWQDAGHEVIFVIGDGTGQAGDPSGKTRGREKFLTKEELKTNASDYIKQAGKIVRFDGNNPVQIKFNGDWLNKLNLTELLDLAGHFSLQQLSERDLFQERIKRGEEVNLREALYPLLQAYDSVALEVDLEIGGTDQTFNMLQGRKLVREMQGREKFVMTTPLLTDSQGNKIGKTEGNVIALSDAPSELFRKIMGLGDDVIAKGLEYLTDISISEVEEIKTKIEKGTNPIEFKKKLAYEVTKQLNGAHEAKNAQEEFERVVQKGELPKEIEERNVRKDQPIDENLLVELDLASSKSEAKRLFEQNGVALDGQKIKSGEALVDEEGENLVLSVGKKMIKLRIDE